MCVNLLPETERVVCSLSVLSACTSTMAETEILYRQYIGESDLPHIMSLVQSELSEPYVIYTYRYFLHQWYVLCTHPRPPLAYMFPLQAPARVPRAFPVYPSRFYSHDPSSQAIPAGSSVPIGVIVCKQSMHKHVSNRGYIAMLSVNKNWRKRGVGESRPLSLPATTDPIIPPSPHAHNPCSDPPLVQTHLIPHSEHARSPLDRRHETERRNRGTSPSLALRCPRQVRIPHTRRSSSKPSSTTSPPSPSTNHSVSSARNASIDSISTERTLSVSSSPSLQTQTSPRPTPGISPYEVRSQRTPSTMTTTINRPRLRSPIPHHTYASLMHLLCASRSAYTTTASSMLYTCPL